MTTSDQHIAYIALGSNLQEPIQQIHKAFASLATLPETRVLAKSSLYRTLPVGYDSQPDFINAVAKIETGLEAHALLSALLALETSYGRERSFPNAPRVIDLDILMVDDMVLHDADLTLPHPRMHERGFVLFPLAEIAPEIIIPDKGSIQNFLEQCQDQGVEKI